MALILDLTIDQEPPAVSSEIHGEKNDTIQVPSFSEEWLPPMWTLDGNVEPQSPPDGSEDGTFRSNDSRLSVTSGYLSSDDDDDATSIGPMIWNGIAKEPSTDAPTADAPTADAPIADDNVAVSDANSLASNISSSTNSWVDETDDTITEPDMHDPYDWETEPLPELTDSQLQEYRFLESEGIMPIRDETDSVYRCPQCVWEVEYGYCPRCRIWYDGIAPPDCEWRSQTPSEFSLDLSDIAADDVMMTVEPLDQFSEASEPSDTETAKDEADSLSRKFDDSDDKVGEWLRNIAPRLETLNNSALGLFKAATCMAGPQGDETQAHLSNAQSLDNEAITQLRLDRWDYEFFKRKVEREQEQVQDTIKELENQLQLERKRVKGLELELKDMKEVLRIQTAQAEETERLQSEMDAYKTIAKAQWRSEVASQLHERRTVFVDAEESIELPRKRQTPMARDTRGEEED